MTLNICMVGYGMMGVWHSEALKKTDAVLHTVVGRRPEAAKEFAERYGYKKWTVSLDEALADPATGSIANRREIARPTEEIGRPDGAATDMEGYYWSAGISSGMLNRWSPDGKLDRQIPMPCTSPTMPCFGGSDMKTIYVTSLRHNVSAERLAAKPLSGGIFALRVDVPGVPVPMFKG